MFRTFTRAAEAHLKQTALDVAMPLICDMYDGPFTCLCSQIDGLFQHRIGHRIPVGGYSQRLSANHSIQNQSGIFELYIRQVVSPLLMRLNNN